MSVQVKLQTKRERKEQKAQEREEETDTLLGLFEAQFDAAWQSVKFAARGSRLPQDEVPEILFSGLRDFAASVAIEEGVTREDYIQASAEAFDRMSEEIEEEEDKEDDPTAIGGLNCFPMLNGNAESNEKEAAVYGGTVLYEMSSETAALREENS